MRKGRWRVAFYLALAALAWCVALGLVLYFAPLATSETASGTVSPSGSISTSAPIVTHERIFTLSLSSLWPLIVPAAICALATWGAARRHLWAPIVAIVALAAFALVASLSIGLFYWPAVLLLLVSVVSSIVAGGSPNGGRAVTGGP